MKAETFTEVRYPKSIMRPGFSAITGLLLLVGCNHEPTSVDEFTGGDPELGRRLIYQYGCGSCHLIPGVPEANGMIGPPLSKFAQRTHIAGALANTPENLTSWIMRPAEVDPETAMPDSGVTDEHARPIAAYLFTLK